MAKKNFSGFHAFRPQAGWPTVSLSAALFITLFDNQHFWHIFLDKLRPDILASWSLLAIMGVALTLLLNLVFTLFAFRWTFKPFLALMLLLCANVSYFADTYGVIIDKSMIHNILETNVAEATELLTWPLFRHLTLYAFVPIALLFLTRVRYFGWKRELFVKSGVILGSLALVAGMGFANYKEITLFGRANKDLEVYINPTHVIHSLKKVVKSRYFSHKNEPFVTVAEDARRSETGQKEVLVLVVGETARSQSFSLNGYQRNTNPQLANEDVISFPDVEACGTATAESLPCMFSLQERDHYSLSLAKRSENLLDILNHTGVNVVWRDNDSGSKGVSDRVVYESLSDQTDPRLCNSNNCFDEILLEGFEPLLAKASGANLIILHTKGSHGPSYYKRTPEAFKPFLPECAQDNVQDCSQQELVNAYDNTIFYTDYLLSRVIEMLKAQDFATAMLYVSDHGESLGENGIYLHGLPYSLAPAEQTHVPLIFWANEEFLADHHIDRDTLVMARQATYSHDNLFHSLLGLFNVKTASYQTKLDMFATSKDQARVEMR